MLESMGSQRVWHDLVTNNNNNKVFREAFLVSGFKYFSLTSSYLHTSNRKGTEELDLRIMFFPLHGGSVVYFSNSSFCSVAKSCPVLCDPINCRCQASLSFTISWSLLRFMSVESVMLSNHLILCRPSLLLPSVFPFIRVFSMSLFFVSGDQNTGDSASASVLPMNIQDWFPLGLTGLICLQYKGLSRVFSSITVQKHQFFSAQPSFWSNSHIHTWLLEKP